MLSVYIADFILFSGMGSVPSQGSQLIPIIIDTHELHCLPLAD